MTPGRKPKDRSILEGTCIVPFREALKSPVTKVAYERRLVTFLDMWEYKAKESFLTYSEQFQDVASKLDISRVPEDYPSR